MPTSIDASTRSAGFWSAVLATLCSLLYVALQLAEWLGWLGSGGGPERQSTPEGLALLLTPSLCLAPAFLILLVSVHQLAPAERKVWSHAAVAFGTAYFVLVGMTYFVQLTLVAPRLAQGRLAGIEPFVFVPFDSFLYAVDILGYSCMSVATLLAARVFTGGGLDAVARRFLLANGLLLPFLMLQLYWHDLIWIAALWGVTFPGATWTLAVLFHRAGATAAGGAPTRLAATRPPAMPGHAVR